MQHLKAICKQHQIDTQNIQPLNGGDINDVFLISAKYTNYVIKLNSAHQFPHMFEIEAKSLKKLSKTQSFIIPDVVGHGELDKHTYLLLEYVETESHHNFTETFAASLAKLHQHQSENFGLDFDNFIGRLPQQNLPKEKNAVGFYINLRLEPQFKLAHQNGFEFKNLELFFKNLESIIPNENASLIHGDLWSGNYLITKNGKPCIFDPAIAFAPREMDLAMMKLFGGYPQGIFDIYNNLFPLQKDWEARISLWQLYYILVHLNLFGASYYDQAQQIIKQFNK